MSTKILFALLWSRKLQNFESLDKVIYSHHD